MPANRTPLLSAARAFGVVLGGPILLWTAAAGSAVSAGRSLARGRAPRPLALAGLGAAAAYVAVARPWLRRWGATPDELEKPLPGDELVPDPGVVTTRAVTIDAPVEEVWPWLAQIGQDRGGFYSYEWLENLAGAACETPTGSFPSGSGGPWGRPCSSIRRPAFGSPSSSRTASSPWRGGAPSWSSRLRADGHG